MDPLVSVCCISFNHEKYIGDCINGFLIQKTNFPIEMLIFDDASKDDTQNIIKSYAKNDSRIVTFLQTENQWSKKKYGFNDYLFPAARGKYIALCEGDDYWIDPLKLQKQVDLLEQNPDCSMCVAQTNWVNDSNEIIEVSGIGNKSKYDFNDILNKYYFHTSTYLIPKQNIDLYISNPKLFLGDTSLRIFMADIGPILLLKEVVSVYRLTGNGVWSSLTEKHRTVWHIKLYKAFYKYFKKKYKTIFIKKVIYCSYQLLIIEIKNKKLKSLIVALFNFAYYGIRNPIFTLRIIVKHIQNKLKKYSVNLYNFKKLTL